MSLPQWMWDKEIVDAIKAAEDPWEKSRKYRENPTQIFGQGQEDKETPIETIIFAPYRAFYYLLTGDKLL